MNIRVIGVVVIIVLFALTSGYISYSMYGGTGLKDVYSNKNIQVIQKTNAGSVPHEVTVKNNGNDAITVKKGETLASSISSNMVFAEDKSIGPKTEGTVKVFSLEPSKRAIAGTKLLPVNTTYDAVTQVIKSTDLSNSDSTYNAQLQIWEIMTGGNLNPYSGEPVALVKNKNLKWSQFRQDISKAKSDVMSKFNVNENELGSLKDKKLNIGQSWIDNTINYIKSSLGI